MRPPIRIDDPEDPRVAPYRALRERDAVARRDGFIAEGAVVLARAVGQGRFPLRSLLLSEGRWERICEALRGLAADVPVHVAPQDVLDRICGFNLHRGVLGWGVETAPPSPSELLGALGARAVVIGLVGVNDPENMGAIFRNAAAFGADAVLLDPSCCDPLFRRAIRVSVGASLIVPYARLQRGEDMIGLLHRHGFATLAFTPAGETPLADLDVAPRSAPIFGAEGAGLPAAMIARARSVRIPMADGFDSLNVGTASGIALHRLLAGRSGPSPAAASPA